jgi:CheY-like chemotaxis protein
MVHVQNGASFEINRGIPDQIEHPQSGVAGSCSAINPTPRYIEWLKAISGASQLDHNRSRGGIEEENRKHEEVKILIIEDDKGMTVALKHFLEPVASKITVATHMEEALKIVSEAKELHLITVDLGLPDSDVKSTIQKIKDIRVTRPNCLIIVVTGQDIPGIEAEAIEQGADAFIFKQGETFTSKGFLNIIGTLVTKFLSEPTHYKRSVDFLEQVSSRLAQLKINETKPLVNESENKA